MKQSETRTDSQSKSIIPAADHQAGQTGPAGPWMPMPLQGDYPPPQVLRQPRPFIWRDDLPAPVLYAQLGHILAQGGDLYRRPGHASGLVLASPCRDIPPSDITTGVHLASVIADRVVVCVQKEGRVKGGCIPAKDLNVMLRTEVFLQQFPSLDRRFSIPMYLPTFVPISRGYNDGGRGQRLLYVGPEPEVRRGRDAINKFLDVIAFAGEADRANAVAGALTVLLRNLWPGQKPMPLVTSTKSRGGKGTVVEFMRGSATHVTVSYQTADWAFQRAAEEILLADKELGVLNVDNVRVERGGLVASAFLERFLTDPTPLLGTQRAGTPTAFANQVVVTMTANAARLSPDLMNRALPIHLTPVGDLAGRTTPIGDPLNEFLPANRGLIEAELRGMVEVWRKAGMPLERPGHTFSAWARAVGGILTANGIKGFLANCPERLTMDDPVRHALGVLGLSSPDRWLDAAGWLGEVIRQGLKAALIPSAERESPESRRRAVTKVLSVHAQETFAAEDGMGVTTLRLESRDGAREFCFKKLVWRRSGKVSDDNGPCHPPTPR